MSTETEKGWRKVKLWTLTQRVEAGSRRPWRWVRYTVPGFAPRLALMGRLCARTGLLEFKMGRGGVRLRKLRRASAGEKKGAA